jgi:hypothetical protein
MLSLFLSSILALTALSAPLGDAKGGSSIQEATQPTIQVLPSILGLSGQGCPEASLVLSSDSQSVTVTFPSFTSPEEKCSAYCIITIELAGAFSDQFHGINFDVYGNSTLVNKSSLSGVQVDSTGKLFSAETQQERENLFGLRKVLTDKANQIRIDTMLCAKDGGYVVIDTIKLSFAAERS